MSCFSYSRGRRRSNRFQLLYDEFSLYHSRGDAFLAQQAWETVPGCERVVLIHEKWVYGYHFPSILEAYISFRRAIPNFSNWRCRLIFFVKRGHGGGLGFNSQLKELPRIHSVSSIAWFPYQPQRYHPSPQCPFRRTCLLATAPRVVWSVTISDYRIVEVAAEAGCP